ncbi:hypothetical protein EBB07_28175 [Paenibacillaceae bacterium]|nr:hypothetical protein EBB07_28175 [Paenibacillaceae bacterium]
MKINIKNELMEVMKEATEKKAKYISLLITDKDGFVVKQFSILKVSDLARLDCLLNDIDDKLQIINSYSKIAAAVYGNTFSELEEKFKKTKLEYDLNKSINNFLIQNQAQTSSELVVKTLKSIVKQLEKPRSF